MLNYSKRAAVKRMAELRKSGIPEAIAWRMVKKELGRELNFVETQQDYEKLKESLI